MGKGRRSGSGSSRNDCSGSLREGKLGVMEDVEKGSPLSSPFLLYKMNR